MLFTTTKHVVDVDMTVLVFLQRNVDERDRLSADCVGASCLTIKLTHTLEGWVIQR